MRVFVFAISMIRGACCLICIKKLCARCQRAMIRFGWASSGKQRWRCVPCAITNSRMRHDTRDRHRRQWFIRWLTGTMPAAMIAKTSGITIRGLHKRHRYCWAIEPQPPRWASPSSIVVLDGTSLLPRQCVALIAYDIGDDPRIAWMFAPRETAGAWSALLAHIPPPRFVVCDGQKGLLKALQTHWPMTIIQRCLIHVVRQSMAWITQHPQTRAGQELLVIVRGLLAVRTRRQKRRWLHRFWNWSRRQEQFLSARTRHPNNPKRWWYTHRKLRRAHTLIQRSIPHLFTFVHYPEVPRTSNHVEGGINARLHELFRAHRGISLSKKRVLTAYFLLSKLKKKTTRNVY